MFVVGVAAFCGEVLLRKARDPAEEPLELGVISGRTLDGNRECLHGAEHRDGSVGSIPDHR